MALINRKLSSETYYPTDGTATYGDAEKLSYYYGGDDKFLGEDESDNYVAYGDAYLMSGSSRGGRDTFYGGDYVGGSSSAVSVTSDGFGGVSGVHFGGDADTMTGNALGGGDFIYGGINSTNVFAGDALGGMFDQSHGGADRIEGGDAVGYEDSGEAINYIMGDGYALGVEGFGDTAFVEPIAETHTPVGGRDILLGGDALANDGYAASQNIMEGDGYIMGSYSRGGADAMMGGSAQATYGGATVTNIMMGDAYAMLDNSIAGADAMRGGSATAATEGGAQVVNLMVGDAFYFYGDGAAGNDVMVGGSAVGDSDGYGSAVVVNYVIGDSWSDGGSQTFGSDKLTGGNASSGAVIINLLVGDTLQTAGSDSLSLNALTDSFAAFVPSSLTDLPAITASLDLFHAEVANPTTPSIFGNDVLTSGTGYCLNELIGDAAVLLNGAVGGNDVLVGGSAGAVLTLLIGDAVVIEEGALGGDDRLVSGRSNDLMFGDGYSVNDGDGGADSFVFLKHNGNDVVYDFREDDGDKIDLSAFRAQLDMNSFAALQASGRIEDTEDGALIHLNLNNPASETDTVLIIGVSADDLDANCFGF